MPCATQRSPLPYDWALFLCSWALFAATATSGAFWLDSSELAAAGVTLGVPHPPGHPLYVLLSYIAALFPAGTVGFRVAMLSAACSAAAVVLVFRLSLDVLSFTSRRPPSVALALWPAMLFGISEALWLQSNRAEVYALHLLLILALTRTTLSLAKSDESSVDGRLMLAALLTACGLANHHLLVIAALPGLAVLAWPTLRSHAGRLALPAALASGLGLLVCLYGVTYLRAQGSPVVNYGDPSSLSRLWAVITAQVFVPSVTAVKAPFAANLSGALDMYLRAVGPVLLFSAPLGLWIVLRRQRALGFMLVMGIAFNLGTKVFMVLDPSNPDAAGYFLYGMALTAVCSAVAFDHILRWPRWGTMTTGVSVFTSVVIAIGLWPASRTDLSTLRGPVAVDSLSVAETAPDALVFTSLPFLHFNRLYQQTVEGHRPDILTIHQGLEQHVESGRSLALATTRRDPRTAEIFEQAKAGYPTAAIRRHARQRPVYIEPSLSMPLPVTALSTTGIYYRVTPSDQSLSAQSVDVASFERIRETLGDEAMTQRESLTTLGLMSVSRVVIALRRGDVARASAELESLNALSPLNRWASVLEARLSALRIATHEGAPGALNAVRSTLATEDFEALLFGASSRHD